jgi:hypothetical protein
VDGDPHHARRLSLRVGTRARVESNVAGFDVLAGGNLVATTTQAAFEVELPRPGGEVSFEREGWFLFSVHDRVDPDGVVRFDVQFLPAEDALLYQQAGSRGGLGRAA